LNFQFLEHCYSTKKLKGRKINIGRRKRGRKGERTIRERSNPTRA
jgi:hypothetical protein